MLRVPIDCNMSHTHSKPRPSVNRLAHQQASCLIRIVYFLFNTAYFIPVAFPLATTMFYDRNSQHRMSERFDLASWSRPERKCTVPLREPDDGAWSCC